MALLESPFAIQQGAAGVPQNSRETLINMFAEQGSGRASIMRRQRPGVVREATVAGEKRGIARFTHGHYFVARDKLYKFDGATVTTLGSLDTQAGRCTFISDDNDNVAVSDGSTLYHWDGSTLTKPTTPTTVGTVAFQGGFGIYNEPNAGQFYVSALNDLTSWDALDFATAEGNADAINRVLVDHNEVWFFGDRSVEIWRNSGNADFPFQPNTAMERGCLAPFSIAADDNTIFWLGDDKIVYRADGYRPARISTHAVEEQIMDLAHPTNAEAFIYTFRGHKFYTLRFPGELTLQFNIATGLWNRAKTYGVEDWQIIGNAKATDYYLIPTGVASLDKTVNTDDSKVMERIGISASVTNNGEPFTVNALILEAEMGRVAVGADDPKVTLEISRDGETWGNARQRGLGQAGDFNRRAVWRNLGRSRQMTARFTVTDDVTFNVMAIRGDVEA